MTLTDLNKNQKFLPVTIRPAQEKDTPQVLELTSQIWDGEDYVPEVWSEWLQDKHGILIVAENNGRILGTAKLSLLTSDQWWLEGLRVDPGYQGKGIASQMHDFLINFWEQNCDGVLRFATISTRTQVHHLAQRSSFKKINEFIFYSLDLECVVPENLSVDTFSKVRVEENQSALNFILGSETYLTSGSVMDFGWKWAIPDANLLQEAVQNNSLYWHQDHSALIFCTEISDLQNKSTFHLRSISCKFDNVVPCLKDLRQFAVQMNFQSIEWIVPKNPELLEYVDQSGFKRDWEESLYIYERQE